MEARDTSGFIYLSNKLYRQKFNHLPIILYKGIQPLSAYVVEGENPQDLKSGSLTAQQAVLWSDS